MLIQRINDGAAAEHVDVVVTNVQGATITAGLGACYTTTPASVGASNVVLPATNQFRTYAGHATRTIPNVGVGTLRAHGYVASVLIYAHGTSVTINTGDPMGVGPGSLGYSSSGIKNADGPVVALEAVPTGASAGAVYIRGFVRAL